jgi:FHA domain
MEQGLHRIEVRMPTFLLFDRRSTKLETQILRGKFSSIAQLQYTEHCYLAGILLFIEYNMAASLHQRRSSDITIQLLEHDSIPPHASVPELSLTAGNAGILMIETPEGFRGTLSFSLLFFSEMICLVTQIMPNSVLTVGRSRLSSKIVFSHPTVSRKHLVIYSVIASPDASNSLIFVEDTNSMNGTYYNSRRIPRLEPILLNHGDYIDIRHAARIYLLQPDILTADINRVMGDEINKERLESCFHLTNRLVGEGGQAKIL